MKKDSNIDFLESYFRLFKASLKSYEADENSFAGIIQWDDDDEIQEFLWESSYQAGDLYDLSALNEFLSLKNCMNGDRICTSVENVVEGMLSHGWEIERTVSALKKLCSIKIAMVDRMEITDYFFVHF